MDITKGPLLTALLNLTLPAIAQAVLSNCYAIATEALSAGIGLQIIAFSLHNLIPSGATVYISQWYGSGRFKQVGETFKVAFYTCIIFSSLVSLIGQIFCSNIASLSYSSEDVSKALESFLSIILLASPAFGLMLLVDSVFKSCGNTRVPLLLECFSLLLNTVLNYIFVINMNYGIRGTAVATAISRFVPALLGLYGIFNSWIPNLKITFNDMFIAHDIVDNNDSDDKHEIELVTINENVNDKSNDIDVKIVETTTQNSGNYIRAMIVRSIEMIRLGIFESLGDFVYGFVFTCMIRYAGILGPAQQAGLGSGMRGVEWIAFCVSEGFLIAAITAVGQNIGAELYLRAMHAALLCSFLSAFCTGLLGVPFVLFSKELSSMLSSDAEIIKYCSEYVFINGFVMSCVGFEMASFGAFLGSGKSQTIFYVNGFMNISRIFIVAVCLTGGIRNNTDFWNVIDAVLWVVGVRSQAPSKENLKGNFSCIVYAVAMTCILKSTMFLCLLSYRYFSRLYFSDCNLIDRENKNNSNKNKGNNNAYELVQENDIDNDQLEHTSIEKI